MNSTLTRKLLVAFRFDLTHAGHGLVNNGSHLVSLGGLSGDNVLMNADGFNMATNSWGPGACINQSTVSCLLYQAGHRESRAG